mgnify:FL=1
MAYQPTPSFGAAFAQAFSGTLAKGIDERTKRRDELLDLSINSAKRKAPGYAKAENNFKSVMDIGDKLKSEYGVTDAEFVALTQEGDIFKTYEAIVNEAANRRSLFGTSAFNRTQYKNEFMSAYNIPKDFLPDGPNARENAIRTILGINTSNLQNETDPKSESGADNSFRKTLANFFVSNPKLSAEKALEGMQVMGYDANSLIGYTGVGQDVDDRIKREREVLFDNIDYDQSSMDDTQRKYQSLLSTRLTNIDQGDQTVAALDMGIMQAKKDGATEKAAALAAKRSSAMAGSRALAKLERQLIIGGRDLGLGFVGSAGRRSIIDGIFDSVDTADGGSQIQTLIDRVNNDGEALAYIKKAWEESDGIIPQEVFDNLLDKDFDPSTGTNTETPPSTEETPPSTEETPPSTETPTSTEAAQEAAQAEAEAAQEAADAAKAAVAAAGLGADVDTLKAAAKRSQDAADAAAKRAEDAASVKEVEEKVEEEDTDEEVKDEVKVGIVPELVQNAPESIKSKWTAKVQTAWDKMSEEEKQPILIMMAKPALIPFAINQILKEQPDVVEDTDDDSGEETTRRTLQDDLESIGNVASTIKEKVTGGISALASTIKSVGDDAKTSYEHDQTYLRVGPGIFKWLINSGLPYNATLPEIKEQIDGWVKRNDPNNNIPEGFSSDKDILDMFSEALQNPSAFLKR